jgi:phytoene dehydrogenase-like protein
MTDAQRGAHDAIVVGAGPNGLAAAIEIARAGLSVLVLEAEDTIGGGCRTEQLTLPGFHHDVCAAVLGITRMSPYLSSLPLGEHGLAFVDPELPAAHPLGGGRAVAIHRSVEATAAGLGEDEAAWRRLHAPLAERSEALAPEILGPLRIPRRPDLMARFGLRATWSAAGQARRRFRTEEARAAYAGFAAHATMSLRLPPTAGYGVMMSVGAQTAGWPFAVGGAQALVEALASYLRSLGGEIETGRPVASLAEVERARLVLLDVAPGGFVALAGDRLDTRYRRRLERFRHGPGVFKVDYALDGPVPWSAEACRRAGVVHLGGTLDEIVASEEEVWEGAHPERPYVIVAQQSLADPSRAPAGKHTLWAYCHVPNGSTVDMADAIETQIERAAPGFRDLVLARHTMDTEQMEEHNRNYVGGDINGGIATLKQFFARPTNPFSPYRTPIDGVYLCSSSTPPGVGVHGMCGYWAARSALSSIGIRRPGGVSEPVP